MVHFTFDITQDALLVSMLCTDIAVRSHQSEHYVLDCECIRKFKYQHISASLRQNSGERLKYGMAAFSFG